MGDVAGILLAAGAGRRFGQPKALLRWGADTFVGRLARTWAAVCDPVVVVGGARFAQVEAQLRPPAVAVFNPQFEGSAFTSLQVGLGAVPAAAAAALVGPVDQPLLDAGLLLELVRAWRESPDQGVVPTHLGRPGHPVLLPRRLLAELSAEPDWSTLEKVLERHAADVRRVDFPGRAEVLRNINTPEEYRAFMSAAIRDEQSAL
jgi:CTP:molybdopterin cytidylyltransferase MocA